MLLLLVMFIGYCYSRQLVRGRKLQLLEMRMVYLGEQHCIERINGMCSRIGCQLEFVSKVRHMSCSGWESEIFPFVGALEKQQVHV
jgi:hypothetical protein